MCAPRHRTDAVRLVALALARGGFPRPAVEVAQPARAFLRLQ